MKQKREILSYLLLVIYLLVMAHQSISHTHSSEWCRGNISSHNHQHEDFKNIHHEHRFHIGIFHFFGHLFENISHTSNVADTYLVVVQETSTKKVINYTNPISEYFSSICQVVSEVDAESLPDPPYYQIPYLQKLTRSTSPLRAPPVLI